MTKRIPLHTHKVWAVAADTLCCGWQPGTIEHDGQTYPDIYLTQRAADVEVADMIRERLERFIEDAGEYDGLEDALPVGLKPWKRKWVTTAKSTSPTSLSAGRHPISVPPSSPTTDRPDERNNTMLKTNKAGLQVLVEAVGMPFDSHEC